MNKLDSKKLVGMFEKKIAALFLKIHLYIL